MFTRLLLGSVLGMTLVTFSPAANARGSFVPTGPLGFGSTQDSQALQDIFQGDLLVLEGLVDLFLGKVVVGENLFLQGVGDIVEGERILASDH
jgi:hypothetical protein